MQINPVEFKNKNPNLNYKAMSLAELNKLPTHTGIINFKISKTSFLILNIQNDDSSAVKFFWQGSHDLDCLDLWYDISAKNEGTFIDVGAHTGLYTMTALKANQSNKVISIEPYFLNAARIIANLRLNGLTKRSDLQLLSASDFNGISNFNVSSEYSMLSKGGKIGSIGKKIDTIKLDSLTFKENIRGIKIDTEGEDLKVLIGAKEIIETFKPEIIIEVRDTNKKEIKDLLSSFDYKFYKAIPNKIEIDLENLSIDNVENIYAST